MKKLAVLLVFIAFTFSGTAFETQLQTVESDANATVPAEYRLTVENTAAENRSYSISVLSPKSSWFYYSSAVKVPAGENRTVNMTVSPIKKALAERYRFDVSVREQQTTEIRKETGFFTVQQPYKLHIISTQINRQSFKPGEVIRSSITVQNLDNNPLQDYSIKARYGDEEREETGTEILPGGERRYDFSFRIDRDAAPGQKTLDYTVTAEERIQNSRNYTVTVEKVSNISKNTSTENRILIVTSTRSAYNSGNSAAEVVLTAEIPSYLESITSPSVEPSSVDKVNGRTVYSWREEVSPDGSFSAGYTTRYWMPLTALMVIAVGIAALKRIGSEVKITKAVEETEDGVKVNLEIRNTGDRTLDDMKLVEFIPDIATVEKKFDMNVPKVRETGEGTRIEWSIDDLEPGEHRIIQYRMNPKVRVDEKVELSAAVLKDAAGQKKAETERVEVDF